MDTPPNNTDIVPHHAPQHHAGDQAPDKQNPDQQTAEDLALCFHGSVKEYFRIWAVNLCLTLLTLGVFSAWAKVRKKRYFYSHLTLAGTPFQYLARPVPILVGRVIAVVLFLLYYLSAKVFVSLAPYVLVAGLVLAPWAIVRSAAFNARYSAFRNMTFRFTGNYWAAAKTLYWLVIPPVVLGVLGHMADGLIGERKGITGAGLGVLLAVFLFPWWLKGLKTFFVTHTQFGGINGELHITGGQLLRIYLVGGVIGIGSSIVLSFAMTPVLNAGSQPLYGTTLVYGFAVLIYAVYVLAYVYVKVRSDNLVWNNTRIGPIRFRSTLSVGQLAKLYLTNALGIVCSAGLLIPWAVIRTMKYRVDHLAVSAQGNPQQFRGTGQSTVLAAGAEVGDIFGLDMSL